MAKHRQRRAVDATVIDRASAYAARLEEFGYAVSAVERAPDGGVIVNATRPGGAIQVLDYGEMGAWTCGAVAYDRLAYGRPDRDFGTAKVRLNRASPAEVLDAIRSADRWLEKVHRLSGQSGESKYHPAAWRRRRTVGQHLRDVRRRARSTGLESLRKEQERLVKAEQRRRDDMARLVKRGDVGRMSAAESRSFARMDRSERMVALDAILQEPWPEKLLTRREKRLARARARGRKLPTPEEYQHCRNQYPLDSERILRARSEDTNCELPAYGDGGYPLYYVTRENDVLCARCANDRNRARGEGVVDQDVNWESRDLFCDHCGEQIEAAYVDVNEPEDEDE